MRCAGLTRTLGSERPAGADGFLTALEPEAVLRLLDD